MDTRFVHPIVTSAGDAYLPKAQIPPSNYPTVYILRLMCCLVFTLVFLYISNIASLRIPPPKKQMRVLQNSKLATCSTYHLFSLSRQSALHRLLDFSPFQARIPSNALPPSPLFSQY